VLDPHYGDGLFHFFQEHYFTSITGLMVSQHFKRVPHHDDEAEILRGGMLLSYGLHREAGEIFAQLIERGASPKVRDRAWFYLAKIRYNATCCPKPRRDRTHRHEPAARARRRARPAAGEPLDGARRLRRRRRRAAP
jgi:hypothetical protein